MKTANIMVTLTKGRWEQLIQEWEEEKENLEGSIDKIEQDLAMEMDSIELLVEESKGNNYANMSIGLTPDLNSYIINYLLEYLE